MCFAAPALRMRVQDRRRPEVQGRGRSGEPPAGLDVGLHTSQTTGRSLQPHVGTMAGGPALVEALEEKRMERTEMPVRTTDTGVPTAVLLAAFYYNQAGGGCHTVAVSACDS